MAARSRADLPRGTTTTGRALSDALDCAHEDCAMKIQLSLLVIAALAAAAPALAQSSADRACAQDRATVGSGDQLALKDGKDRNLSDKLAKSGGVICPPAGIDADIKAPTPQGGKIQVIPPPGSPQNQPNLQPK
jgi:hypothetical protein